MSDLNLVDTSEVKVKEDELLRNRANELLAIKYSGKAGKAGSSSDKEINKVPDEINWKFVAAERLQMLTEMRDDMQYWRDAYLHERDRVFKLESRLFDLFDEARDARNETQQETTHTISSTAQVNKRRASWPSFKKRAEELTSVHDAGIGLNSD